VARLSFPDAGMGEHVDWMLQRPEMAAGMGRFSSAVYGNTRLDVREREAARWTIALVNHCAVCQGTRAEKGPDAGIDDGFYGEVGDWRASTALSERERLAAEFAERFALDHQTMDDAFFDRMRSAYTDEELADLVICCGMWLGLGRMMAVVGVPAPEERLLV
jgi:alkylhydroperoxidase family enzyme